jgi:hypothetical protein
MLHTTSFLPLLFQFYFKILANSQKKILQVKFKRNKSYEYDAFRMGKGVNERASGEKVKHQR